MRIHTHKQSGERGVITLLTVIILSATILSIGLAAMFIGQTEVILAGQEDRGRITRTTAMSCIEEAVYRLKKDVSYVGGTIPGTLADCTVVVSGAGSTRTVSVSATFGGHTKQLSALVEFKQNGSGHAQAWAVDSWSEVNP